MTVSPEVMPEHLGIRGAPAATEQPQEPAVVLGFVEQRRRRSGLFDAEPLRQHAQVVELAVGQLRALPGQQCRQKDGVEPRQRRVQLRIAAGRGQAEQDRPQVGRAGEAEQAGEGGAERLHRSAQAGRCPLWIGGEPFGQVGLVEYTRAEAAEPVLDHG